MASCKRHAEDKIRHNAEAHVLLGLRPTAEKCAGPGRAEFPRRPLSGNRSRQVGYQALASFYLREKNIDEAEKVIRAGLEQQPDSFALRLTLASVLEQKGDYEAAIAEYEVMLKQQPGSLIVANNLASLLSDHRTDKASLERAYSLAAMLRKSQIPSFKDTLGWIEYLRGDYKSATALARRSGGRAA